MNRGPASPLLLPAALAPPWYLLVFSNAGGAFPGAWGAIFAVVARFVLLGALPWLDRAAPGKAAGFWHKCLLLLLALDVILLGACGMQAPSLIGGILVVLLTAGYFLFFLVLLPIITALEVK